LPLAARILRLASLSIIDVLATFVFSSFCIAGSARRNDLVFAGWARRNEVIS